MLNSFAHMELKNCNNEDKNSSNRIGLAGGCSLWLKTHRCQEASVGARQPEEKKDEERVVGHQGTRGGDSGCGGAKGVGKKACCNVRGINGFVGVIDYCVREILCFDDVIDEVRKGS
ncbi:hypothetical protein NDU88_006605 [Pleurodeles waltl]|uniref:Uncharacterized protein n=1 Tax=Pleurodeles waltl TaxID=8319 RepID=A0AAV7VQ85_PLEWA|nr:hypothetical protein NDU88_006605 [Pleurodeles waltl]